MARKLSPLTAQVVLDLNKWTAGIRQVQRDADAIGKALKPIGEQTRILGTAMSAAGAAVGGALLLMAKKAADFGDALLDASKRTGMTTQQLASLKLLADQSGSSFEGLSKGVGMLSKTMFEAATKGGQSAKLFDALGISVKDASGNLRNASDVLPEIADRFSKLEDGSAKTALAMKLFGRAGADLIPLLNEGSAGFQRAREQADKFGISLTRAEAELGDKFNDSLADSKAAMQGFANSIGVALLPALTDLVNKGNDWIAAAARMAKAHPELTKAVAATSGVLFGAGGLLLGFTGLVSIAPKVKIALDSIGGAATLGKAGLIGMAAAVGYLTGKFINAQIEASGYQNQFDKLVNTIIRLNPSMNVLSTSSSVAAGDTAAAAKANAALEAKAKQLGVTTDELRKRSVAAWEAQKKLNAEQKAAVKPVNEMEKSMRDLMAAFEKSEAVDKAAKDFEQFRASVDGIKATVTDTTPPSKELVTAIHEMDKAGQMTSKAILNLAQHVDTLKNSKDPLIQQYVRMIPLMQLAAKSAEMEAEGLKLVADTTKEWADQLELVIPTATDLLSGLEDIKPLEPGDLVEATAITRVKELNLHLDDMKATVPAVERQVRLLRKEGKTNAEIMAVMGGEMEAAARTAKQFNLPLGELTRTIIAQESRVQALRGAWGQTFANLSDHLVDMVTDFDFSFKRLGDIAKDTAKSLLRSFLDGFFKPFKDQLAGLGENLAGVLSGALFGGGGGAKGGIGGALNGLLGMGGGGGLLGKIPGIGALLGGGAAVAGTTLAGSAAATSALAGSLGLPAALSSIAPLAGPGGAAAAGGAAAGGGGLMASIGALATNPITIAAAGAGAVALLIKKFTGQGRETADIFGEAVQNPLLKGDEWFKGLENIIDPITKARESGTLTVEMIQSAQKALEADWKKFAEISQSFIDAEAGVGGKEQLVVDQAFKTLTPIIEDIRTSLQTDLARVSGSPGSLAVIPSVNPVDTVSTGQVPQANVAGGLTITGGINLYLNLENVHSPQEFGRWLELNLADIRTKIIKAVDLADGGDGSGLVTAH